MEQQSLPIILRLMRAVMMANASGQENATEAPRFAIPTQRIVSVEHPCIIKNVDKGIDMLGGGGPLSQSLDHASKTTLPLRFDADGQSILSLNNQANNILLRVAVPKRVGKRKRGSTEPFMPITAERSTTRASDLLTSIKDNPEHVKMTPLGMIENSHVFRSLPDFIYSTSDSAFKSEVKTKLIGQDLASIKLFQLPQNGGSDNIDMYPPPILSTFSLPQTYSYLDKPATKAKAQSATTSATIFEANDLDVAWPKAPLEKLPWPSSRPKPVQELLSVLKGIFKKRQMWTSEELANKLPDDTDQDHIEQALPYVAFRVATGPWAGTYCRYGVDPRSSPLYAAYQTIDVPTDNKDGHRKQQLIDITDPPHVASFLRSPSASMRSVCEPVYHGWYQDSTLAKLLVLLQVSSGLSGHRALSEEEYQALLALSEQPHSSNHNEATQETIVESMRHLTEQYQHCLAIGEEAVRKRHEMETS